jgi:ubiquinone/menaquinone biosynthesis C-methylase UbiE
MGFTDLFAQNVLLRWLLGRGTAHELALSMTGVRLGERVAQLGLGDGGLCVALAGKVGYTGRVCGVDEDAGDLERTRRAAERAGVLVELEHAPPTMLPLEDAAFDLVVVMAAGSSVAPAAPVLGEALRILRPGGRCVVLILAPRAGVIGAIAAAQRPATALAPAELVHRLQASGFRASRQLALRDGLAFVEAMKAA